LILLSSWLLLIVERVKPLQAIYWVWARKKKTVFPHALFSYEISQISPSPSRIFLASNVFPRCWSEREGAIIEEATERQEYMTLRVFHKSTNSSQKHICLLFFFFY
jgi:hypothetical protein